MELREKTSINLELLGIKSSLTNLLLSIENDSNVYDENKIKEELISIIESIQEWKYKAPLE